MAQPSISCDCLVPLYCQTINIDQWTRKVWRACGKDQTWAWTKPKSSQDPQAVRTISMQLCFRVPSYVSYIILLNMEQLLFLFHLNQNVKHLFSSCPHSISLRREFTLMRYSCFKEMQVFRCLYWSLFCFVAFYLPFTFSLDRSTR